MRLVLTAQAEPPAEQKAPSRPGDGPQVICPDHLGLMQGLAEGWRAPFTVDRLEPFVEPDLCLVRLGSTGPGA